MSDNALTTQAQTFRALDDGTAKWPAQALAYPTSIAAGANVLQLVDATHGLPASIVGNVTVVGTGTLAVQAEQSGTWTVQSAQSGIWSVGLVAGSNAIGKLAANSGVVIGAVEIAAGQTIAVTDGGGSLTVDAPAATPVFVRLSNGAAAVDTLPVSGTFWQATQPVSIASLPALAAGSAVIGAVTQSGTWNIGNISGAISLPTGAATAAKQPAPGIAGTASTDVLSVQGISGMTALKVDGSGVTQPVSGTFWQATQPVSLASLPSLAAGANAIGKLTANSGVTIGAVEIAAGQSVAVTNAGTFAAQAAQSGTWTVGISASQTIGLAAGTAEIGNVKNSGTFVVQATLAAETTKVIGTVNVAAGQTIATTNAGAFPIQNTATATSSGISTYHAISAASNNAACIKAQAGQVYGLQCFNTNAAPRYLKFYNKATAPAPASDTVVKTVLIPGNTAGGGVVIRFDPPIPFATGIAIACVTGMSDTDNTSTGATEVSIDVDYK